MLIDGNFDTGFLVMGVNFVALFFIKWAWDSLEKEEEKEDLPNLRRM